MRASKCGRTSLPEARAFSNNHEGLQMNLMRFRVGLMTAAAGAFGAAMLFGMQTASATSQTGMASWYMMGQKTANGERFEPLHLTAAHRTLPFGTKVRVTNLQTGQSVVVRINDRGPFVGKRIIDLSLGAADVIGMTDAGVAKVRVDRLYPNLPATF